ncbi:S10 family peptidase [Acetobacter thailandicus]|uniref:Peptidase S10 n=1 Tax=Acetobacter thailandicus TaxID=1502842 RepID=A0ABT3QGT0_9PROT|nr:peptidase S10 [Acetobacter thailandicus]MCX2564497.1 peptidase S10 [Acetobacter thailandicus]NHN96038.1 peptidase S10 [Acetobacter thailandicus]
MHVPYFVKKTGFPSLLTSCSIAALLCLSAFSAPVHAEQAEAPSKTQGSTAKADTPAFEGKAALLPQDAVTHHTATFNGHKISYTARAGTLTLRDKDGHPSARIFYVAYTQDGAAPENRPVSFFFNGGPGAGTAYLHLGAAGPEILSFPAGNPTDGANAKLAINPDSWLPSTDMVFLDAPGTGWSVPTDEKKAAKEFYGVKQDARAFAKAIQLWSSTSKRLTSPRYLAGESYGGIRSIEVANALMEQQSIIVNGLIMISPALDMSLLETGINPLATAMALPTFEAANLSLHHQLQPDTTARQLNSAYSYALGPYLNKLVNTPPAGDAADTFYNEIAQRTGIPVNIVKKERGALEASAHDIRSRDGRLYSLYDATLSIADPYPEGVSDSDSPEPTLSGFGRAYGSAFEQYAASDLKFATPITYNLLDLNVNASWDYRAGQGLLAHQIPVLRQLLALNPSMRVFIANGYFDLACPFATSRWVKEHIPVGQDRISLHLYSGGHMLYTRPESRAALTQDVKAFLSHS